MQTSKISHEGPTRAEILRLITCHNFAHHEVDQINTVPLNNVDRATVESLESLENLQNHRLLKHSPLDADLDPLIGDIQEMKRVGTEQDWDRINWESVMRGVKAL
jgi:hypothetical protein